jgi:hypothetical protein
MGAQLLRSGEEIYRLMQLWFRMTGYCAPNLTDTSFDTPGSCIVTP